MVYHDGHNATAMKTNGVLLRNRQIHGEFTVILSSENMFVAVMVVAIMVFVCGRHGCGHYGLCLWPSWFVGIIIEPC